MCQNVERRVDKCKVREGLRKVAKEPFCSGIVLLGEQADVGREPDKSIEQREPLVAPAEQLVAVDEPEGAREEDAFAGRESVRAVVMGAVAQHEPVLEQIALDRLDRSPNARVGCRQEADQREQEQACVELLRSVGPHERSEFSVKTLFAYLRVDRV